MRCVCVLLNVRKHSIVSIGTELVTDLSFTQNWFQRAKKVVKLAMYQCTYLYERDFIRPQEVLPPVRGNLQENYDEEIGMNIHE